MKPIVILGAGTAGTMVANGLAKQLPRDYQVTVVDPTVEHLYQPELLFIPFGKGKPQKAKRARSLTLRPEVEWIRAEVEALDVEQHHVVLADGRVLPYEYLVLATGTHIAPEETPGLLGPGWRETRHDFYTLEGALALEKALREFPGGRLVLNVVEMPIKCPVAPLEFLFLADDFFRRRGMREKVELVYATPLDGAFTRPVAAHVLGGMLADKGIQVEPEFNTGEVDGAGRKLVSYDGREVPYDLLVAIPTHKGADFLERTGWADELGFAPTDPNTLQLKVDDRAFALGDATDLPSSKAGSVAHFQSEVVIDNILHRVRGEQLDPAFDGHANCFVESGAGKALLIDFNYDVEPLPGTFPMPLVGPFTLLKPTRRNHWGKLAFRWLYWNRLLPAKAVPVSNRLSMRGKKRPLALGSGDGPKKGDHHAHA